MRKNAIILALLALLAGTVWACLWLARPPSLFAQVSVKGPDTFSGITFSKRYRFVRVNRRVLDRVAAGQDVLELELFDSKRHLLYFGEMGPTATGGSLNYGRIGGIPGSQVVLATQEEAMAASIYMPDGRKYTISYCGEGVHVLQEVDSVKVAMRCLTRPPAGGPGFTVGSDGRRYQKYYQVRTVRPWGGANSVYPVAPPVPRPAPVINTSFWGAGNMITWGGYNVSVRRSLRQRVGFSLPPQARTIALPMGTVTSLTAPSGTIPLPPKNAPWIGGGAQVPVGGPLIEILVCWTTAAKNAKGGLNGISAVANSAVGELNLGLRNSHAQAQASLVGSFEVTRNSSGNPATDLDNLSRDTTVRAERDRVSADLVHLLLDDTSASGTMGVAFGASNQTPNSEMQCWSVSQLSAALGSHTFAHEVAHNLGCMHNKDQGSASGTGAGNGPFAYSHGWRWQGADRKNYRSIMSYQGSTVANEQRVLHFSNPAVTHQGAPTGDKAAANNAATITAMAPIISKYRPKAP